MSTPPIKRWTVWYPFYDQRLPRQETIIEADSCDLDSNSNLRFWRGTGKEGVLVAVFQSGFWSSAVQR